MQLLEEIPTPVAEVASTGREAVGMKAHAVHVEGRMQERRRQPGHEQ